MILYQIWLGRSLVKQRFSIQFLFRYTPQKPLELTEIVVLTNPIQKKRSRYVTSSDFKS